tara:strand:+ start:14 stop:505 length:492 start_codon:yes stop_codon:yes gene_type:complete
MAIVKTITINGKANEYNVQFTKAYVAKIISAQSDLYQELIPSNLPYNAVKEIYVDDVLVAELIGSELWYKVIPGKKPKHDPYVDRQEPTQELEDESHSLDMALNDMIESMTEEELAEFYGEIQNDAKPTEGIYLQSVNAAPPYWVSDTTASDLEITYTLKYIQ